MSELIQRAARAIYKSQEWEFASDDDYADLTDGCKHVFETAARAAIEAMREPTEEMVNAVYMQADPGFCDEPGDPTPYDEAWRQMINAALTDTSEPAIAP